MSLTQPLALLGLLILPAVVLLYFLKRKRTEHVISSTLLWQQAIRDLRVNSPFQRLRRNLLLLLQLLILGLLVLALAGPAMNRRAQLSHRTLLLIDTSGSMRTKDVDGETRLRKAQELARLLVEDMGGGDEMMVVSFSSRPRILQTWTLAQTPLIHAIDSVRPTDAETDVGEALRIALGLAATREDRGVVNTEELLASGRNLEVTLISDGAFGGAKGKGRFQLEVPVHYVKVGGASDNVAITALKTDRGLTEDSPLQLFARVQSFAAKDVTCEVELRLDGDLLDVREILVPARGSMSLVFDLADDEGLVRLYVNHPDALQSDNVAHTVLRRRERTRVLLVRQRENYFLDRALRLLPSTDVSRMALAAFEASAGDPEALARYDVILLDACAPKMIEEGNFLFLGALPPIAGLQARGEADIPALIDWPSHPVNRAINYGNLFVKKAFVAEWPKRTVSLLEGDRGPLITAYGRGRLNVVTVAFDLAQSDWPLRVSFPLFLANAVRYLAQASAPRGAGSIKVGQPIVVYPDPAETLIRITPPGGGRTTTVPVSTDRRARFTDTRLAGLYRGNLGGSNGEKIYAVNMVSAAESDNAAQDVVALGGSEVQAKDAAAVVNQEIWKWFALIGLGIVLTEWYIYNRKTYL